MADSKKATSAQAPGDGDVWNTVPSSEKGASSPEGAPTTKAQDASKGSSSNDAKSAASHSDAPSNDHERSKEPGTKAAKDDEELLDAVLEAEAAAIIDNAMDEARAEAAEKAAEAEADAQKSDADAAMREAAEWKDKYVRLHAEWDTYRRRQKEQAEQQKALAAEKLVNSLIPVIDDLERSIDYAQKNGEQGLLGGVEAVLTKFIDTLKKDGVDVIYPAGEAFNALEAQAVGTVDDPSVPDETVADVYQKGFKIGTKVLRPAMVTVATGGPKRPKEE